MSQPISTLTKALDLIDEMSHDDAEAGVSDLARRLGMTKNQVFRILKTLETYDYVRQRDDKTYNLGLKFFEIGQRVLGQHDLVEIALPLMDDLRDTIGESVHLCVRDGLHAVCVAKRDSTAAIRMAAQVGVRYRLHAGACPKAILAFQPARFIDEVISRFDLSAYTENTVTDPGTLLEHLATIRRHGFSESEQDVDPLAYAVAVPIVDQHGSIDAAMSIAGPSQRFDQDQRKRALVHLARVCDQVSAALGASTLPGAAITCDEVADEAVAMVGGLEPDGSGLVQNIVRSPEDG